MLDKYLYTVLGGKTGRFLANRILIVLISSGLLFYKLGSLIPKPAYFETPEFLKVNSLHALVDNPLNILIRLPQYLLQEFDYSGIWALRGVSAVYGLVAVMLFYNILRHWHTKRISFLGTILFATSSWFLHSARMSSPDILQLFILGWLWYGLWLIKVKRPTLAYFVGALIFATSLYIPGFVWVAVAAPIWQRNRLKVLSRKVFIYWRLGACLLAVVLLVPLWWSFINHPRLILEWLGLPNVWPDAKTIAVNLVRVPWSIFLGAPANPHRWLDHLPILDIFSSAMLIMGILASKYQLTLDRTKQLGLLILAGSLLISINGAMTITLILPLFYILIASGMSFILRQWLAVFPRNPAAAYSGVTLLAIAICLSAFFQLKHYFVAWPKAPETKRAYQLSINNQNLSADNWYNIRTG